MSLTAMNRTRNVLWDPPLPVEPSYFIIPTFIQALFTILQDYFRPCAHVSIVGCRAPKMMVMGYQTHHFQSNHCISWYLPSSKPYSQPPTPSQGNAHTFPLWIVEYRGWWWWTTMGFISRCWIHYSSLRNFHFHKTLVTPEKSGVLLQDPSPGSIAVRPKIHQKKGRQNVWSAIIIKPSGPIFVLDLGLTYCYGNLPSL